MINLFREQRAGRGGPGPRLRQRGGSPLGSPRGGVPPKRAVAEALACGGKGWGRGYGARGNIATTTAPATATAAAAAVAAALAEALACRGRGDGGVDMEDDKIPPLLLNDHHHYF